MKQIFRIWFLIILIIVPTLRSKETIKAGIEQRKQNLQYTGILMETPNMEQSGYQFITSFKQDVKVKVTVELDETYDAREIGGHIQFAFVKDEEHSLWADDIALYPKIRKSYTEEFLLYAGNYTFEMYLIRRDLAFVPFRLKMQIEKTNALPMLDKEARLWIDKNWKKKTIQKKYEDLKVDLYEHIGYSSWKDLKREDFKYHSSNTSVATVNKKGKITIKQTGNVWVTVTHPNGKKVIARLRIVK